MEIRKLLDEDYETLCEWWRWWRWTPVLKNSLPDSGKGGVMVQHEGVDVCAGFLYTTNSDLAYIEWTISNPNFRDKIVRKEAIKKLIETLTNQAKELGCKFVFTYLINESLKEKFEDCGFIHSNKPIEMIKKL